MILMNCIEKVMTNMMNELTIAGTLVIVIIGICQALKYTKLPIERFIPLIAIALGVGFSFYMEGVNWMATLVGVVMGLTSSGLFSGFKKTVLNK